MKPAEYRRRGYTILELMLSLVLLATLMMVAWSILGAYRNAEQRGWNQAYQMQVIRIARDWLETDAVCLMEPRVSTSPSANESQSLPAQSFHSPTTQWRPFKGDEQGFEVDLIPSLNPLAWLEEIVRDEEPLTTTTPALDHEHRSTAIALDPLSIHRLRYKIISVATTNGIGAADSTEPFFDLQRELVPNQRWSKASPSSSSEKMLETEDLYRISEDDLPTESETTATTPATSIRNLIAPRFRYSDGKDWLGQWDSQLKGGLPRAIELSFDLPAASTSYEAIEPDDSEAEEFVAEDFADIAMSTEPVVTTDASTAAGSDDDALTRDVRIVVLVPGSTAPGTPHE